MDEYKADRIGAWKLDWSKVWHREKNRIAGIKRRSKMSAEEKSAQSKVWVRNQIKKMGADGYAEYKRMVDRKRRKNASVSDKIKTNLRSRLWKEVKRCGNTPDKWRMVDLIGCDTATLKEHLESQFTDGMRWDNYGKDGWHVDHITPCSWFDLTNKDHVRQCFHYTNTRPMWAEENIRRKDARGEVLQPELCM